MAGEKTRLISLLGSALLALSLTAAHASPGSGSGGDFDDPDPDYEQIDDDNSGSGGDDFGDWDDELEDHDEIADADDQFDDHNDDGGDDDRDDGESRGEGNSGRGSSQDREGNERDRSDRARAVSEDRGGPRQDIGTINVPEADRFLFEIEYDELGVAYVRGEALMQGTRADIAAARRLGFQVVDSVSFSALGSRLTRLKLPQGSTPNLALSQLRDAAPDATVTLNTVYRQAQSFMETRPSTATSAPPRLRMRTSVGVIDTGVDAARLPVGALAEQRSFVGARSTAHDHGLAVATIAAEHGARVHLADVFGQSPDGALAASAAGILAALNWMMENNIPIINISVEGPDNALIAQTVRRAAARGHILIAAAGNSGPAARPAFPAAFEGVVAVTAIDEQGRPYLRANRGQYIDFAAEGVNVEVSTGGERLVVSGTSFAAPRIASELALRLQRPSPQEAARALAALRNRAEDLGDPGHDAVYGWGAIRD